MDRLDQLIAAAQQQIAHRAPQTQGAHLAQDIGDLIGANLIPLLAEFEVTSDGLARFVHHGIAYSLQLLPVGVVLARHDPPPPEGMERPRPYALFSGYWPAGQAPGRTWFLIALGQLAEAARR
ncbi:MAG: hypothetical protein IPP13_21890 [Kouleothrix sp.]|jgi:hypothetical protein|nr:hypothetical protein [Kouleothrix sp.]